MLVPAFCCDSAPGPPMLGHQGWVGSMTASCQAVQHVVFVANIAMLLAKQLLMKAKKLCIYACTLDAQLLTRLYVQLSVHLQTFWGLIRIWCQSCVTTSIV